jgi:hypothetical protein
MPRPFLTFAALALLTSAAPAWARTAEDEQAWINVTLNGSAGDRLVYFVEAQPRLLEGVSEMQQAILRGAIGIRLSDRVSLYQGYAYIAQPRDGLEPDRDEQRSFQQLSWTLLPGATELSSRTRFEQRWVAGYRDMGLRVRQLARLETPIAPGDKPLKAVMSLEGMFVLNDTDWGSASGFDQLRSFVGLEVPLKGRSTVEAGYLNQLVNSTGGDVAVNHVLSVTLSVRP